MYSETIPKLMNIMHGCYVGVRYSILGFSSNKLLNCAFLIIFDIFVRIESH